MNKGMKIIIYLLVVIFIFAMGYFVGIKTLEKKPGLKTNQEANSEGTTQDLLTIANKYGNVVSLCEEKYQTALSGDKNAGDKLNEQINQLISQINQLLEKYSPSVNTESY